MTQYLQVSSWYLKFLISTNRESNSDSRDQFAIILYDCSKIIWIDWVCLRFQSLLQMPSILTIPVGIVSILTGEDNLQYLQELLFLDFYVLTTNGYKINGSSINPEDMTTKFVSKQHWTNCCLTVLWVTCGRNSGCQLSLRNLKWLNLTVWLKSKMNCFCLPQWNQLYNQYQC